MEKSKRHTGFRRPGFRSAAVLPVMLFLAATGLWPAVIEETDTEASRLVIRSQPSKAAVSVDGFYRGETPLVLEGVEKGTYSITLEKDGYRTSRFWIRYTGTGTLEYKEVLEEETGYIFLDYAPHTASAYLDSLPISAGRIETSSGRHVLEVQEFGYESVRRVVNVEADRTTLVNVRLKEAELRIENLRITPKIFSPLDPGALGSADISFLVTACGSGYLAVKDAAGTIVHRRNFPSFTTWRQASRWDGSGRGGTTVPDGNYTVTVSVRSPETGRMATAEASVVLDRSARTRFRSLYSGTAGLLFTPIPETLPPLRAVFSFGVLAHLGRSEDRWYSRVPAQLGFRISPFRNFETAVQMTIYPQTGGDTPFSAGVSAKYLFFNLDHTALSAVLKGTYLSNDQFDTLHNFTGGSFQINFSTGAGSFKFLVSPEIHISPVRVVYDTSAAYPVMPVYVWGYGRFGFLLDFRALSLGFSGSLRLKPFSEGFAVHWPASAGIEFFWVLPESRMGLSGAVAGEFSPLRGFYLLAGLGIEIAL